MWHNEDIPLLVCHSFNIYLFIMLWCSHISLPHLPTGHQTAFHRLHQLSNHWEKEKKVKKMLEKNKARVPSVSRHREDSGCSTEDFAEHGMLFLSGEQKSWNI